MQTWEVFLLAAALSMDACAVAMTNGMTESKMSVKKALLIGALFGFFQFLMPVIGYFITALIANAFMSAFEKISAWISFGLLAFLGGKMIIEGLKEWKEKKRVQNEDLCETTGACPCSKPKLTLGKLLLQAVATSIDALAVGVTLKMAAISSLGLKVGVWGATGIIGVITLAFSFAAVYIGKAIGDRLADKAGLLGGFVLLGIGIKILIEGLL